MKEAIVLLLIFSLEGAWPVYPPIALVFLAGSVDPVFRFQDFSCHMLCSSCPAFWKVESFRFQPHGLTIKTYENDSISDTVPLFRLVTWGRICRFFAALQNGLMQSVIFTMVFTVSVFRCCALLIVGRLAPVRTRSSTLTSTLLRTANTISTLR